MQPVQTIVPGVLTEIIRRQPPSAAKTAFAWGTAVGTALARATTVELSHGTLRVTARDTRWARELEHNRDVILLRLQHLLGAATVTTLEIVSS
jgi:predicted nucleic acid-binding Zn ribbon protein